MTQKNARSPSRIRQRKVEWKPIAGIDPFRSFIFPNHIRKYRKKRNIGSLLQLTQQISSITYIRLSKIERGEVFARADEIRDVSAALEVEPTQLLIDVDDPSFDIADWAAEFLDPASVDPVSESMAVLLGAALRTRRSQEGTLTIAALETEHGIAPVILSRIENAYKPFDRWSHEIQQSLLHLFGVSDVSGLQKQLMASYAAGELDATLPLVANPEARIAKTRTKVQALRAELEGTASASSPRRRAKAQQPLLKRPVAPEEEIPSDVDVQNAIWAADRATVRLVPVFGAPLADGLVARTATGEQVEAPRNAGPRAYGLRVCRPTLGSGLPGRSIVVVDPDRFPSAGGLAIVREGEGLRLLSITFDRQGRMLGYSEHPDREVKIDEINPDDIATVLSAQFE